MIVNTAYAYMKKALAKILDMWSDGKMNVEFGHSNAFFNPSANRVVVNSKGGSAYFVIPDSIFTSCKLNVYASSNSGAYIDISIETPSGSVFTTVREKIYNAAKDIEILIPEAARAVGNRIKIYNGSSYTAYLNSGILSE